MKKRNIDIDMVIFENIDLDEEILENIDINRISNQLEFGISNRATPWRRELLSGPFWLSGGTLRFWQDLLSFSLLPSSTTSAAAATAADFVKL